MIETSRVVFVDTSAFVALINSRDTNNADAKSIIYRMAAERRPLTTSNFVIAETYGMLLSRVGGQEARRFLNEAPAGSLNTVRASEVDEAAGVDIVLRYRDKNFSLVDGISFAIMNRLGISTAFAFDRDFLQYGFETLQP